MTSKDPIEIMKNLIQTQANLLVSMEQHQRTIRAQLDIISKSSETVSKRFLEYQDTLTAVAEELKPDPAPNGDGTG